MSPLPAPPRVPLFRPSVEAGKVNPLDLAVDALATARITRLVTQDTLTEPVRKRVVGAILDRASAQTSWEGNLTYTDRLLGVPGRGTARVVPADVEDVLEDFEEREGKDSPKLATLATCPWCVGVYVAFGVALVRNTSWWRRVAVPLALSQATGVIDTR